MFIALGSNATSRVGSPLETVQAGIKMMITRWEVTRFSGFYQTPAFPAGAGPDFVNAVCAFRCSQGPEIVLEMLHQIEADFGRKRSLRWGQRTLDLDLIAYGDSILPDQPTFDHWFNLDPTRQAILAPETLILPHPRMQDRSFVLVPLADVAPDWVHPRTGQTTKQMLEARPIDERDAVIALLP